MKNLILLIVVFATGCNLEHLNDVQRFNGISSDYSFISLEEQLMIDLINRQREEGYICDDHIFEGSQPVEENWRISLAADRHNQDMIDHDFFSHTGSDGLRGGDRLDNVNYKWFTYSEVLSKGAESYLYSFVNLMNSVSHCKGIMKENVDEIGVSLITINNKQQWVIKFGATLN